MKINEIVKGVVIDVKSFGVFVRVDDYIGLIRINEISGNYIHDLTKFFYIGEEINVYILDIDIENKRMNLSYKKAMFDNIEVARRYNIKKGFLPLQRNLKRWINEQKEQKNEKS